MAAASAQNDHRTKRLNQLCQQYGLAPLPLSAPLLRPLQPTSFRTRNDDLFAEDLLKRQRLTAAEAQSGTLRRAFTTKKKAWDSKEIFSALTTHVANGGSAGVAECLIAQLESTGGNVNAAKSGRPGLLSRKRSMELPPQRSQILITAVKNAQVDMIQVLLPHADPPSLDAALPAAITGGNPTIVELLLQYGASVAQNPDGQAAFRQLCALGGHPDMVSLILSSDGRPSLQWISRGMIDAAHAGCLTTVRHLSAAGADGNADSAAALKGAIGLGRADIALAILTGPKPPAQQGINEAFLQLFAHHNITPTDKLVMVEMLLLAGANTTGDEVANSLVQATKADFLDMVQLLVSYGASIEYRDAFVVRDVVKRGRVDLVQVILGGRSRLSALYASECVELMPKNIDPQHRKIVLDLLLRKGATGKNLNEALIDASDAQDFESAQLLLNPIFPGGTPVDRQGRRSFSGSQSMVFQRHDVATVDYKGGQALQIAVQTANPPMVRIMLDSKPAPETLAAVFPYIKTLAPDVRYEITEAFLQTGLSGPVVHTALNEAIAVEPPGRDEKLVGLLLSHNTDVNFNGGSGIITAVAQNDIKLLQDLLKKAPKPQTVAAALPKAMEVSDPAPRLQITKLLLFAGASSMTGAVSQSLITALQSRPPDVQLVTLLLKQGKADVNHTGGVSLAYAIQSHDPAILSLVLSHSHPSVDTLSKAIKSLSSLPMNPAKITKLESLLARCGTNIPKATISELLVHEVDSALKMPAGARSFGIIKILLGAGADVNAHSATALQSAVKMADTHLTDLLFDCSNPRLTPNSMASALPRAVKITDPMDRLVFTQRLLDGGAPGREVNRALIFVIKTHPEDIGLLKTLVSKADLSDGEALNTSIQLQNVVATELVLSRGGFTTDILGTALNEGLKGSDRDKRKQICEMLLGSGLNGKVISDSLITAAGEGDLSLAATLIEHGASVDHKEGQAIIAACRAGAADVLSVLLSGNKAGKKTLDRGFQAATEVSDLKKREDIFALLLHRGVTGDIVDAQLVSSTRYGQSGEPLVSLLLQHGASLNYNSGEAIWSATRSAFLPTLEMLLGVKRVGDQQKAPNQETLTRALKASGKLSPDTRLKVTEWLFKSGLKTGEEVHIALTRAVNEEVPDEPLISMLLTNGASPLKNGCRTFVDAARRLLPNILAMFMQLDVPKSDISWIFAGSFTKDAVGVWFCEAGLEVARTLLQRGAGGEGPARALVTVIEISDNQNADLADRFIDIFLASGIDVNYEQGLALQLAAGRGDGVLIQKILKGQPNSETLSRAIPKIFTLELNEDEALELVQLFTEHHGGGEDLDVMTTYGDVPILFKALDKYPRSIHILQALLDAGYYHDQVMSYEIVPEADEEEHVSLLLWSLLQPQKRVSSSIIELLIDRQADPNFASRLTSTTPLMAAVAARRSDIVHALLVAGSDPGVQDFRGATPLTIASGLGGESGNLIMRMLLKIHPSINDGSLHTAAAKLDYETVQLLLENDHEPDFPSTLHGGRSALAETVLHASDVELTPEREKRLEKIINLLLKAGSDPSIQSNGKSVLILSLSAPEPVATTRIVLKSGLWKHVNSPSHQYKDATFIYSPSAYVTRVLRRTNHTDALLTLLRANRAVDTFYAHTGPQPPDAVNLPPDFAEEQRQRQARARRIADAEEDHALTLRRARELAAAQAEAYAKQADLEDARTKSRHLSELSALRDRARVADEVFAGELAREKARRQLLLDHESAMVAAGAARAEAEREAAEASRRRALEWTKEENRVRAEGEKEMMRVRMREREEMEKLDRENDKRVRGRIGEQRRLVEAQQRLAGSLQAAGMGGSEVQRRQIGYITGEAD